MNQSLPGRANGARYPRSLRSQASRTLGVALAGALAPGCFAAADSAANLDPLVVHGRRPEANPYANPEAPYKAERLATGKITEELVNVPKSIVVIPKEVINDAGALSFRDLMRTQPGVTLGTGEGGNAFGDRFFVRGFDTRNDIYIDGVRDPGVGTREIFNVEQVEVLKGPSSTFGGRGTTGGAISLVSKAPGPNDFAHVAATLGTDETRRLTLDVNQTLPNGFAVRVNALGHQSDVAGRDHVYNDRWGVALALSYEPLETLKLSGEYYHLATSERPDWGVGYDVVRNKPLLPDRSVWYGVLARDYRKTWTDIYTTRLRWTPSSFVELRGLVRRGQTLNDYVASAPENPNLTNPDPRRWTLLANPKQRSAVTTYWSYQLDGTARFETLGLKHTLVGGYELSREGVRNRQYANLASELAGGAPLQPTTIIQSVFDPNPDAPWPFPRALSGVRSTRVRTHSLYALDTLKIGERLQLLAGLRHDRYRIGIAALTTGNGALSQVGAKSQFTSKSLGLVYKPHPAGAIYASYGTSTNPSGEQLDAASGEYGGLTITNAALAPERNRAYEAGVKWDLNDQRLALTFAAFRVDKINARIQLAPGQAAAISTDGAQRVEGLEVTAAGNLTARWSVFGGATLLRGRTVHSPIGAQVGHEFPNIAKRGLTMLSRYQVNDRLHVGGQLNYGGQKYGGTVVAGNTRVPAYWRYDLFAGYRLTRRMLVSARVLNAGDKVYFDALYRSVAPFTYVAPGRAGYMSLDYVF